MVILLIAQNNTGKADYWQIIVWDSPVSTWLSHQKANDVH